MIELVLELYDGSASCIPSSAAVLKRASTSEASLSRHFDSFEDLIHAALLLRYVYLTNLAIEKFENILLFVVDQTELRRRMRTFSRLMFSPDIGILRILHAQLVRLSNQPEKLKVMGGCQSDILGRIIVALELARQSGFVGPHAEITSLAMSWQSLTMGAHVESLETFPTYRWAEHVDQIIEDLFMVR